MKNFKLYFFSFLLNLLISFPVYSQEILKIQGRIVDSNGNSIDQAVIAIRPVGRTSIIAFQRSNAEGNFELTFNTKNQDSLELEIRHLGFHPRIIPIKFPIDYQVIILEAKENILQEIHIGSPPVYRIKDTLKYNVGSFLTPTDRVISDIIKKLPGLEIIDGTVLYQGRAIQKFMINELDLMQGQYGLINQNLPAVAVSEVQIIENHQPIKALDSLVFSDKASLNLVVKYTSVTGNAQTSLGANPEKFLWDLNLTPIVIQKNVQALNSLQSNNTGHAPLENLKDYYSQSNVLVINPRGIEKKDPTYLRLVSYPHPVLDKKLWLNNNSHLVSSHILKKLSANTELRGQVSYSRHIETHENQIKRELLDFQNKTPFSETIKNDFLENSIEGAIGIEINGENQFLKNVTRFRKSNSLDDGLVNTLGTSEVLQYIQYAGTHASNKLNSFIRRGKKFYNFSSEMNFSYAPQTLTLQSDSLSLMNVDYHNGKKLNQFVNFRTFETKHKLSSSHFIWKFRYTNELVQESFHQNLNSNLSILSNSDVRFPENFSNDAKISMYKIAYIPSLSYSTGRLDLNLKIPAQWTWKKTYFEGNTNNLSHPSIDPEVFLKYKLARKHELSSQVGWYKQLSMQKAFNPNFILVDYFSISKTDDISQISQLQNYQLRYAFQHMHSNQIVMANLGTSYSRNRADFLLIHQVDSMGQMVSTYLDQQSKNKNLQISGNYSHYLTSYKSGIKLNFSRLIIKNDYVMNNKLINREIQRFSSEFELRTQFIKDWSFLYKVRFNRDKSQSSEYSYEFNNWRQTIEMYGRISKSHLMTIQTQHYAYESIGKHHWNLDLIYNYRIKHWQTDLKFSLTNILNQHQFLILNTNQLQFTENLFQMRTRQFLIGLQWQFGKKI